MVFSDLAVWDDIEPRAGADNMSVDQLLLEGLYKRPILRVYRWSNPTVTLGYFHALKDARQSFSADEEEDLNFVRRWTGGGIVDHRVDVTYTLIIPNDIDLAARRGAYSYEVIHRALADVLNEMGEKVFLENGKDDHGGAVCFSNPVRYDLCDSDGRKVAGAGQRRTRCGLLHQGSVIPQGDRNLVMAQLPAMLAERLAARWSNFEPDDSDFEDKVSELSSSRYTNRKWSERR